MPHIPVDPAVMTRLFENSKRCMAAISTVVEGKEERVGNGYVVHCDDQFTVVSVNASYNFHGLRNGRKCQGPKAIIRFCDGTMATNTAFIWLSDYINLIVARIDLGGWQKAKYGELSDLKHEKVFSLVTFGSTIAPLVGQINSRRAIAVRKDGDVIPSSRYTFTFSLPMVGRLSSFCEGPQYEEKFQKLKNQALGSPVFDIHGLIVGFVDRFGLNFDFKYGIRSEKLKAVIDEWLDGREWREAVQCHINID